MHIMIFILRFQYAKTLSITSTLLNHFSPFQNSILSCSLLYSILVMVVGYAGINVYKFSAKVTIIITIKIMQNIAPGSLDSCHCVIR